MPLFDQQRFEMVFTAIIANRVLYHTYHKPPSISMLSRARECIDRL